VARIAVFFYAFVLVLSSVARADTTPNLDQTWSGVLNYPTGALVFVIAIATNHGKLTASAASPYQGSSAITVDSVSSGGGTLRFAIKNLDVTYSGSIGSNAISGTFTQHGSSVPLVLVPNSIGTSDLAGAWLGTLATPNGSLLLGLRIVHGANGQLNAIVDSPYQSSYGLVVTNLTTTNQTLRFDIPSVNASFAGAIGLNAIGGAFTQNGATLPLTFTRP
jgi:hypothetical protein